MDEGMTAIAEGQTMSVEQTPEPAVNENELPGNDKQFDETQETEGEGEEGAEGEGGEQTPQEPEETEVEFNGKKYKVHPDLKDGLMMRADHTRKTMEVAELRKAVEAKQAEVAAAFDTSQEVLQAKAHMLNIDGALEQYKNVNWAQWENEDPMAATSHWRQFQQLKEQRGEVAQYLDKTHNELSEKAAQETDKRLRETAEFAAKELKGWTPELDNKITDFATKELGFTVDILRGAYNPQVYKTLYLAHIGHQALQKQTAAPKPVAQQAPKPLTTVSARSNGNPRPSVGEMTVEQMAAYLNKR